MENDSPGFWENFMDRLTKEQKQQQQEQKQEEAMQSASQLAGGKISEGQDEITDFWGNYMDLIAKEQKQEEAMQYASQSGDWAMSAEQSDSFGFAGNYMDLLAKEQKQEEAMQYTGQSGGGAMSAEQNDSPDFWGNYMNRLAKEEEQQQEEEETMQYGAYSQPIKVIEIEQKDLKNCLENLKDNALIPFTTDHDHIYSKLMKLAGTDAVIDKNDKFLVAKNEQNQVVGIGKANFVEGVQFQVPYLDFLLSVAKGAGTAIVNAIIDYSRQMEKREDLFLLPLNDDLIPYYAKFGFLHGPQAVELVRQKSKEFDPNIDITTFEPLERTKNEIQAKRRKAMGR